MHDRMVLMTLSSSNASAALAFETDAVVPWANVDDSSICDRPSSITAAEPAVFLLLLPAYNHENRNVTIPSVLSLFASRNREKLTLLCAYNAVTRFLSAFLILDVMAKSEIQQHTSNEVNARKTFIIGIITLMNLVGCCFRQFQTELYLINAPHRTV